MIDLRSDVVTQPTDRMRHAAATAETGNDGAGEDPTVNELERLVAEMVGMDDALFVPSGTMANQIAARTHTEYGQEAIVEEDSHIFNKEVAGLTQLCGLQARPIDGGARGIPTPDQIQRAYSTGDIQHAETGLLALENTHNKKGGIAIEPGEIESAAEAGRECGIPTHLDGARIFHAAVALDRSVDEFTRNLESVYVDFTKIGAPVGAALAGDEEFIRAARRNRQLFGGHMKQSGVIAAPAIESLSDIDRLERDQQLAKELARGIVKCDELDVEIPETNLVFIDTSQIGVPASKFISACEDGSVLGKAYDDYLVRFCTHGDVDGSDIEAAIETVMHVIENSAE